MTKPARRSLFVLIVTLATAVFGFFALRWFEYAVTFHPQAYNAGPHWAVPRGGEDVWLSTSDGVRIHGWFLSSMAERTAGTIIYFHGNAGNLSNVAWLGRHFANSGFDILLLDYRGYGRSQGKIEDETDLYSDGNAAYDYVINQRSISPDKVVLYGQSLGTVVAIDLASRKKVGALIIESGLSSASSMARTVVPWLPSSLHWMGRYRFESELKLAKVECPVLVTHGDPDNTIPTAEGQRLFAAAKEPKRLILVPGADHNVLGFGGERYLDSIASFIHEAMKRT